MTNPPGRPYISADRLWYWDGTAWRTLLSPDGSHVWTGREWVPRGLAAAPDFGRPRRSTAVWAVAGGGGAAVLALVITLALVASSFGMQHHQARTAIPCNPTEQLVGHYHVHLAILNNGHAQSVPARVGIELTCIRWLHTHDTSGVVHVEIPRDQLNHTFTLADFFGVWQQPLSSTEVARWHGPVTAWVQGGPGSDSVLHRWTGNPAELPLHDCDAFVLEVGRPAARPGSYTFPPDFGCDSAPSQPIASRPAA